MQIANQSWCPFNIIRCLEASSSSLLGGVFILDLCASTNDYLLSRTPPAQDKFNLCVARTQSAGRGRRGKTWHSEHDGIYLSVAWRTRTSPINDGWLLLMTALRLAESLQAMGVSNIGIKWPNDLYYKNAKMAGVLLELHGNSAVMGIGLNITTPIGAINQSKVNWIGLDQTGVNMPTYTELVALVANVAMDVGKQITFDEGKKIFSKFDILYNRSVEIERKGKKILGIAKGIDRQARLLVDHKGQLEAHNHVEISIYND